MDQQTKHKIEKIIGYSFSNPNLLVKAFTHSSAVENRLLSNERLEFFGDAALDVVICQLLFERFPTHLEGELTKIKSMLVSRDTCSNVAKKLGLTEFLKVGKGMNSHRALSGSLSAGLLEAVIAAVYLDGGFEAAKMFIKNNFAELIEHSNKRGADKNFKSLLQQYAQDQFDALPHYELLDEKGPDHNKCFEAVAVIGGRHFTSAWGVNKKQAEQKAAFNALVDLGIIEGSVPG